MSDKIPAVCIIITRAEGPSNLCGKARVFTGLDCWAKATAFMLSHSASYPAVSCDKHDFVVVFSDGETYEGRLDAKQNGDDCDVQAHVREFVQHMTGSKFLADSDRAVARDFLTKYDLGA